MGAERTKWTSLSIFDHFSHEFIYTREIGLLCIQYFTCVISCSCIWQSCVSLWSFCIEDWFDWTNESINVTQMLHKFVQKEREELVPHSSLSQLRSCSCLAWSLGLHQSWWCILSLNFHGGSWDCSTLLNKVSSWEVQWFSMHLWSTTVTTLCFVNFKDLACFQSIS